MKQYLPYTKPGMDPDNPRERSAQRGLLVLAYYYPPVNESGALRPARFCKYLPQFGYHPVVITAAPATDSANPVPGVYHASVDDHPDRAAVKKLSLMRALQRILPYTDKVEWAPKVIAAASQICRHTNMTAVVSTSPPIATHLAALWLKRRHKLLWIADFRDPLVGNPYRNRWHGRPYDAMLERCIVSQADAVIMNTDAALRAMQRRYPRSNDKFRLIWNGYDAEDDYSPRPIPPRNHKVLVHVGSIYGGRHPGQLVDSLARLLERGHLTPTEFRLRLVGVIELDMPWIANSAFASLVEYGCIEYSNEVVPRSEAHREMAEADYLLLLDVNALGSGLQVPGKIFEYIRIGRPILAFTPGGSPAERMLGHSGVRHTCVSPDSPDDEIDRKVREFFSLSSEPLKATSWFQSQFDARTQTEHLACLLSSLIRNAKVSPDINHADGT